MKKVPNAASASAMACCSSTGRTTRAATVSAKPTSAKLEALSQSMTFAVLMAKLATTMAANRMCAAMYRLPSLSNGEGAERV